MSNSGNGLGNKATEALGTVAQGTKDELKSSVQEIVQQITGTAKSDQEMSQLQDADAQNSAIQQKRLRQELHQMVSSPTYSRHTPKTAEQSPLSSPGLQEEHSSMDSLAPITVQRAVTRRENENSKARG